MIGRILSAGTYCKDNKPSLPLEGRRSNGDLG